MSYETVRTESERTRYVEPPALNEDGTADSGDRLVPFLYVAAFLIAIAAAVANYFDVPVP